MTSKTQVIIFFDGICHLCNGIVNFISRHDTRQVFQFAPLQGETAKQFLNEMQRMSLDSVIILVLQENQQPRQLSQAKALLSIFAQLSFPWKILSLIGYLPDFLLNLIYLAVARNRYRLFGKRSSCRIPSPEEKLRLLP